MKRRIYLPCLLKDFFRQESTVVTFDEVYSLLTDGGLRDATERYRRTRDENIKRKSLSITPACQLDGKGKEEANVAGLTHVVMADFDHLPKDELEVLRKRINDDPHTFLSYCTISGEGLRVLARYREGMPYADAFIICNSYYADLIGKPYDEKCINVNRLSALCHDEKAYYNPEAAPFEVVEEALPALPTLPPRGSLTAPVSPYVDKRQANNVDLVKYCVDYVENKGSRYEQGNRNQFLMQCLMMMNHFGVPQFEAESWAIAHDLGERETRSIVKSCYRHTSQHGDFEPPSGGSLISHLSGPSSHTPAREYKVREKKTEERPSRLPHPFPERPRPTIIQQMVDCGKTKAQRDVILLSAFTVIGATLCKLLRVSYSNKYWYPNLQFFAVAPPASGKGVITWVRRIAEPFHQSLMKSYREKLADYEKERLAFDIAGKEKKNMQIPEAPKLKMFLISGNNSGTGILENLMDSEGCGLICETEADTVSKSINSDYGGWSDTLRKSFEHDRLSYNRRANHEYREIDSTRLSVLLSGTPAQVKPLIPSAENGLYSRQIFYNMPPINEWEDQFGDAAVNFDRLFLQWGKEWKRKVDEMQKQISMIELKLTLQQRIDFNSCFSTLFNHAGCTREDRQMQSSVARLAINILRMMSITAALRALENNTLEPYEGIATDNLKDGIVTLFSVHITDEDFSAVLSLADPLYRHAAHMLSLLPKVEVPVRKSSPMEQLFAMLPMTFTRAEAVKICREEGIKEHNLDVCLTRMVNKKELTRDSKGMYSFTSGRM